MSRVATERRSSPRTKAFFSVELPNHDLLGETLNVSTTGICLKLDKCLLPSSLPIVLNLTTPVLFKLEIQNVWSRDLEDGICVGARFSSLASIDQYALNECLSRYKVIDLNFVKLTLEIRHFLHKIKQKFGLNDVTDPGGLQQINNVEQNKERIFGKLDKDFNKVWGIAKDLDKKSYDIYKDYFYQMLEPLLGRKMEINSHIYQKPLGYPGDYMVMNYILDYHKDRYLGDTSYQKLINNYTCNIPISKSNVRRKEFFKERILTTLKKRDSSRILTVGSGPVRELIELATEEKLDRPLEFKCIDFEERTSLYVKEEMSKIKGKNKRFLKIKFIQKNIPALIRDKKLAKEVGEQDLIYSSGLFDYMTPGLAKRLIQTLFEALNNDGELIVCNASLNDSSHRAYYELLGDWVFYHRTQEELIEWTKNIQDGCEVWVEKPVGGECYLYLHLKHR